MRRTLAGSLTTRLIALALAASLPLLVFSVFSTLRFAESERKALVDGARRTAAQVADGIDAEVAQLQTALTVLAATSELRSGDFQGFERQARIALKLGPDVISLYDREGQQLASTARTANGGLRRRADTSLLQRVFASGQPEVSQLLQLTSLQTPGVGVVVPVMIDGAPRYLLAAGLRSERISERLRAGLPAEWQAALFDRDGLTLARSVAPERFVGTAALAASWARMRSDTAGVFSTTSKEGVPVLSAFQRSPTTGWTSVVSMPTEQLQRPLWQRLAPVAATGMALVLVALLLAWLAARAIARPVLALRERALPLLSGESAPQPSGVREVDALAQVLESGGRALAERNAALRASEERSRQQLEELRAIYDLAPVGLCVLDRDLRYVRINERLAEINGIAAADHLGRSVGELLPALAAAVVPPLQAVLDTGVPVLGIEINGETPAQPGVHRTWIESWLPLRDGAGVVTALNVVAQEITDRKRLEAELARSERRFRTLFESMTQGVVYQDAQGHIVSANARAVELLGLDADALAGRRSDDPRWRAVRRDGSPLPGPEHPSMRALATGQVVAGAVMGVRAGDGPQAPVRWLAVDAVPVGAVPGGGPAEVFALFSDITTRLDDEARRERVLEREQQARRLAEDTVRSKDEFLAMVSHELRSPLNAIVGWNRILAGAGPSPELVGRACAAIERSTRAQLQVIEDLFDTARIVTGKLRLDVMPLDPLAATAEAIEPLRAAAQAKGVLLALHGTRSLAGVLADPVRLQQIVSNLVGNAIKFTDSGGRVDVTVEADAREVWIGVSDSGIGIEAAFLPMVFDRFTQADSSATRRHGGLGLGLALVKHLVQLHGGSISAESGGAGKGACFTVRLPRQATPALRAEDQASTLPAPAGPLTNLHVLVLDDDPDALEVLRLLLEQRGASVVVAASCSAALAHLQAAERPPDAIVSDLAMPGLDGYDFISRLRAGAAGSAAAAVPVLALSAFARDSDRARALRAGFDDFLAKPPDPEHLAAVLRRTARAEPVRP